ncbi:hypothetical protein WKC52_19150 [Morganella morganii]|uniref:hypothetical protein n=1 Tax=Morganella morganii TaxID=582 RepID=UPI0009216A05|nr:hypothetical protein [Morganella morganii]SGD85647.1 Uncharacterised protein [Mycobacterium tuberculosis]MBA5838575.1 hypothetical protein [Morganella morganii]MBV0430550.1 hypothetical protein [Morganella morganii subsp. morganii]HCR4040431.1 hypothetical protein [Morganella morganii]HCR4154900.1 hypothetical protein [Morganella morganii]
MKSEYVMHGHVMKFFTPEPDPKDICNLCGGHAGKDNLIQGQATNICFDCADLAKQLADEKRKEIADKELNDLDEILRNMTTCSMPDIARQLYRMGYRKIQEG